MSVVSNNILAGASGQGGAGGYEIERSLRFNALDSAFLSKTLPLGNRQTWTWSAWVKKSTLTGNVTFFSAGSDASNRSHFMFDGTNHRLRFFDLPRGVGIVTDQVFRDTSAWYHIVLAADTNQATASNRIKIYVNGSEITHFSSNSYPGQTAGLQVNKNVEHRLGSGIAYPEYFNGYIADVHFIDGQALAPTDFGKTDNNGVWQPIAYAGTYGTNGFHLDFADNSSNAALGTDTSGNNNTWTVNNLSANEVDYAATGTVSSATGATTGPVSRIFDGDLNPNNASYFSVQSSGSHTGTITFSPKLPAGTTIELFGWKGTSASSGVVEVNGTDVSSAISPQYNSPPTWGNVSSAASGGIETIKLYRQDGVQNPAIAGVRVDGVVLVSGTPSNTDSLRDTPTNGTASSGGDPGGEIVGNYSTLNPLTNGSYITLSNGNLEAVGNNGSSNGNYRSTVAVNSGKWYAEVTCQGVGNSNNPRVGIILAENAQSPTNGGGSSTVAYDSDTAAYANNGDLIADNSTVASGTSYTVGDVIGIAVDADNGAVYFSKNGVFQNSGVPTSGATKTGATKTWSGSKNYLFAGSEYNNSKSVWNFGQRAFAYPVSGYKSLNTASLPEPTIADGSQYFDTKLWSGNNTARSISTNFSPDFVWTKLRNVGNNHNLFDSVRGVEKKLRSSADSAEATESGSLTAFNSDGFSLGTSGNVNGNGYTFVAWAWDAGASTTTIAAGSLNSSLYDQSQNWSSYGDNNDKPAESWEDIFDGNGVAAPQMVANSGATAVWTPTSAISFTKLELYANNDGVANITLNGSISTTGTIPAGGGANIGWADVTSLFTTKSLTSIEVPNNNNSDPTRLGAIRVNGKILVDSGVSITTPSIASTVRANPSAGFSIVKYTGNGSANATTGHGLNQKPSLIIYKDTDTATDWRVIPTFINDGHYLALNNTNAIITSSTSYFGTNTSSVLGITGSNSGINNASGKEIIAYCFAPVEGYSAIGSYTGNGSADGPFVFTGHSVAWIMIKRSDAVDNWVIYDVARDTYNIGGRRLYPDLINAESQNVSHYIDILSNGFKARSTGGMLNASGENYIFMSFASHPFKTARAR